MTAGCDRAFRYAAKPGNAVHCIAANEAVRDCLWVSANWTEPTIDPPNQPFDPLVTQMGQSQAA